jgi:hypothetical protein
MEKSTPLFGGLDVHRESIAVGVEARPRCAVQPSTALARVCARKM